MSNGRRRLGCCACFSGGDPLLISDCCSSSAFCLPSFRLCERCLLDLHARSETTRQPTKGRSPKRACLVLHAHGSHFLASTSSSSLYTTGSSERSHGSGGVLKNCSSGSGTCQQGATGTGRSGTRSNVVLLLRGRGRTLFCRACPAVPRAAGSSARSVASRPSDDGGRSRNRSAVVDLYGLGGLNDGDSFIFRQ